MKTRILILTLLTGIALGAKAQTNSQSPYSIYGIGDEPLSTASTFTAMGHTQIAMVNPVAVNVLNPASFSQIGKPVFNFDLRSETLLLNNGNSNQSNTLVSIQNLTFAFPLLVRENRRRNAGMSFGLVPKTQLGYEVLARETHPDLGTIDYLFKGDGGLNGLYLGFGYDLLRDSGSVNTLTLGVKGEYVFGNIQRKRYTLFDPSVLASNVSREVEFEVSDANFSIGLNYVRRLFPGKAEKEGYFSAGAYFQPSSAYKSFERSFAYSFSGEVDNLTPIDTILNQSTTTSIQSPSSFGVGFGFSVNRSWTLGLDLSTTRWSELKVSGSNAGLNNANRVSLGGEYIPDYTAYKRLFQVMRYRAGGSFQQSRLNINGVQPVRYGINVGLGIPLYASRSTSMFNLALEYARRESSSLPVSEAFWNIHFGMSITPHNYDRWFNKRKYD